MMRAAAVFLGLGVFAHPAAAQFKLDTSLAGIAQYDSNVFRLPSDTPSFVPAGGRSDRILLAVATANLEYKLDQQRLYMLGDGTRYWYKNNSFLDHNEYSGQGGFDWRASDAVDGSLSYQQSHRMVPEEARAIRSEELAFQTNRNASAGLNVNVAPQWRVETRADAIKQDAPSPTVQYKLDERDYTVAGKYLGLGLMAVGAQLQYIDGHFTAPKLPLPPAPPLVVGDPITLQTSFYRQYNEDLTIDYTVNHLSKFTSKFGLSQRRNRDDAQAATNGFTGELKYKRTVSALTDFTLGLFRKLQSYPSFNDYVTETGGSAQLEWHPTLKINTSILTQYIDDTFHSSGRSDKLALLDAGVSYEVFEHFAIKPGFHFEDRHSSGDTFNFVDRIYSVEAKLTF